MTKKKPEPVVIPVHINEFFALRPEIRTEVQAGFNVYMKGRRYQNSIEDFDAALDEYHNRKLKKAGEY